ncbi:hypothetical protein PCS8203_00387 [Streptococcus pneumoniae PCS8203]|nr:hypothetical protein CGSSp14BS292_04230 [Streptococcus pneumoniae SP14-BS292]EFL70299.1 hypothetical protein CGSSpBS293_10538 [Streptococcus pneumoniae SP-BS293]EFL72722.1 hypothetical protein CGSSpBS458_01292 [Streptococcus pneumoniae BS458]EFL74539.1 hypothetical protein CGSSpBS457_05017 [Streptococcus pneumoniae BS457]EFL76293.1 hypothetical protein CGSSpBS397_10085 [Streptococcus pneumoniae BS397]EJG44354.1 hypothetical protein AMCSP13_001502 [Streptococcus pneumoniae 2070335]ELU58739.
MSKLRLASEFDFHLLEMKLMRDISRHLSQDIMENDKKSS